MNADLQQTYRQQFTADLARLIGCQVNEMPASVPQNIARKFLDLSGPRTLNTWIHEGRHNIQSVRVGRKVEFMRDWLIQMKVDGLRLS